MADDPIPSVPSTASDAPAAAPDVPASGSPPPASEGDALARENQELRERLQTYDATLRALAARRDLRRSRSWRLAERSDSARFTTDVMFTQTRPTDDRQTQSESDPIRRSFVSMGENKFPREHAFPAGFFALTRAAAESGRPARSQNLKEGLLRSSD